MNSSNWKAFVMPLENQSRSHCYASRILKHSLIWNAKKKVFKENVNFIISLDLISARDNAGSRDVPDDIED
jgi:hypothetical protein